MNSQPSILKCILLAIPMIASNIAMAYDFSASDKLFVERSNVPSTVKAAIESYKSIPNAELTDDEKIYVVEQLSALYIYWGYQVSESDSHQQVTIADQCLKGLEAIEPGNDVAATPQFYFWHSACLMAKVRAQGPVASLSNAQLILDNIDKGRELDPSYEGGGFDRLAGVVYAKLPSFNPFGPAGDLDLAVNLLRSSMDSAPYIHPLNPAWRDLATEGGEFFYATVFYYCEALVQKGQKLEAKSTIANALSAIDNGRVAKGRQPETQLAKFKLLDLQRQLGQ